MGLAREVEVGVEERVAKLESDVSHIRSDISDIKVDIRALREKIDGVRDELSAKFDNKYDSLKDSIAALRVEMHDSLGAMRQTIANAKIWALLMGAALLGVLARGFHWI